MPNRQPDRLVLLRSPGIHHQDGIREPARNGQPDQHAANTQFNILGAKIDAQTQIINDRFCQLEMREMQNKIDMLRQENSNLALAASQQAQTANIVSQLRAPAPVPAYIVQNPSCCTTPTVAVTAAPACAGTLF